MKPDELTVRHAQEHQPWAIAYCPGVQAASETSVPHLLASHNVLHAAKTVGLLAQVFETLDHSGKPPSDGQLAVIRDMAADLMTEALRFANLYGFDLATELVRRVEEKNAVNILNVGKS